MPCICRKPDFKVFTGGLFRSCIDAREKSTVTIYCMTAQPEDSECVMEDAVLEYEIADPLLKHLWKCFVLVLAKDELKTELVTTRCLYISVKLFPGIAVAAKKYLILW